MEKMYISKKGIKEINKARREECDVVKTRERTRILSDLGLIFNGEEFVKEDINVHWTEITCDSNSEFSNKIEKIKGEIERRKNASK